MYTIIGLLVLLLVVINLPSKKKTKTKPKMSWSEYFRNGNWYHELEV